MSNKKLIFILNCPRSGSTLLLSYLCGIPNSKVLYESKLLLKNKDLLDIANYLDSFEEEIIIEKTPEHVYHLEDIEKLRELCKRDIYIIYIIRPPVPTILSLLKANKNNPELFGKADLFGTCEKYEECLTNIYTHLILKSNAPNKYKKFNCVQTYNTQGKLITVNDYLVNVTFTPYSYPINYRELIENPYKVVDGLLNELNIEANIQSLIDNRINNTQKYLPSVAKKSYHSNVLKSIEEVEDERRIKISKQIKEGFSNKYIEKSNYIRSYFEHPITKETIYDLVVNSKKSVIPFYLGGTKNPEVYVVVPLYNKEKYIKETLSSIANQTYKNIRVIIIDDASTDKSVEVAERFIDSLSLDLKDKFSLIKYNINRGVSFIRNKGLAISTDIISFCDADDVWDEQLVEKSVNTFTKYPYIECVYSRVLHKRGELLEKDYSKICNGDVLKDATQYNFLTCGSNLFIRKEVLEKNNIEFDLFLSGCEDWDFLLQLSQVALFKCTKEYLVTYRRLSNSLSNNPKNQVTMGKNILSRYVKDKKNFSRTFTRLFLYYFSIKNLTWENIQNLDFRFILKVILDKFKSFVKSYIS